MQYWFDNCPTLVERTEDPQTVWRSDHSNIPPEVPKHHITDKPYWLQVIHSENLKNRTPVDNSAKIIHRELNAQLEFLAYLGIDQKQPSDL